MNYEAKDLPYNQFEQIGMSKREVLAMPSEDLKALLNGRTTNLQTTRIKDQDAEQNMQVKLSLQRLPDGSLNLMIHPIRKEIANDDKLNEAQLEALKRGETVIVPKTSMNGEKEAYLFQLDRETNEIVKTRLNSISVPRYLMQVNTLQTNASPAMPEISPMGLKVNSMLVRHKIWEYQQNENFDCNIYICTKWPTKALPEK
jgi:hypothetical protein